MDRSFLSARTKLCCVDSYTSSRATTFALKIGLFITSYMIGKADLRRWDLIKYP